MSQKSIQIYRKDGFFSPDFPFAIRHVFNRSRDINLEKRYQREFWKITYIIEGKGALLIDDQPYPIHPRSIFLIHPGAATTYDIAGRELEMYNLVFDSAFVRGNLLKLQDDFHFFSIFSPDFHQNEHAMRYLATGTKEMELLIRGIEKEYEEKTTNWKLLLKLKLLELLLLLLRAGEQSVRRRPEQVAAFVQEYLTLHCTEEITLEQLAKSIGISRNHLCRIYKQETGGGIIQNLKEIRLENAAKKLRETDQEIAGICCDCGFADLSYFYRSFARFYGMTPGDYRKEVGQN